MMLMVRIAAGHQLELAVWGEGHQPLMSMMLILDSMYSCWCCMWLVTNPAGWRMITSAPPRSDFTSSSGAYAHSGLVLRMAFR